MFRAFLWNMSKIFGNRIFKYFCPYFNKLLSEAEGRGRQFKISILLRRIYSQLVRLTHQLPLARVRLRH